jgi:hypothetical protein
MILAEKNSWLVFGLDPAILIAHAGQSYKSIAQLEEDQLKGVSKTLA